MTAEPTSKDAPMRPADRPEGSTARDEKMEALSPGGRELAPDAKKQRLSIREAVSMIGDDQNMTDGGQEPVLLAALHCDDFVELEMDEEYDDVDYHDEMTGAQLSTEVVYKAREEELAYYKSCDAYVEVDEAECYQTTGKGPISCRWKDINKATRSTRRCARA